MKQIIIVLSAGFLIAATASCNKNYTCECRNIYTGEIVVGNIMTQTGKKAHEYCTLGNGQSTAAYTCELK